MAGKKGASAPEGGGLNSASAPDRLRQYIERWERLEDDKKATTQEQKDLMAEAKAEGFDTKIMRKVIALRKRKPDEVAEEEAVLDLYLSALGMSFDPFVGSGSADDTQEDDSTEGMV